MTRIAFTLIGGKSWFGGYNYQLNLLRAILKYEPESLQPYLFLGGDVDTDLLEGFKTLSGLTIIQSDAFNQSNQNKSLIRAIILGTDSKALTIFSAYQIDIIFNAAKFYGWRFPIQTIAWIPDFQHKYLKHLFSSYAYWKRDFGFRLQIRAAKKLMVSSQDAKRDSHQFFPLSRLKTEVVSFAVPMQTDECSLEHVLATYNLQQNYFFLPNQFWKHKNHGCVLEALHFAKNQGHKFVVVSTGKQYDPRDEAYFEKITAMIDEYGLSEQFILLGTIPYPHVTALMRGSKALLNPSYFEGWSTTVEEAKALGIKMVLSNIAVHKEQAKGHADFFDVTSPNDLAQKLIGFDSKNLGLDTQKSSTELAMEADSRVKAYARAFSKLVDGV